VRAGFNVLQLGKPGVEHFSSWDTPIYDEALLKKLVWKDLVANARHGLDFLRSQKKIDSSRIYLLGHSEGTQVAVDVAKDQKLKGLVLLGYSGEDLTTILRWQIFQREIEHFVVTDVDVNRDGFVTKAEAARWPEFSWNWKPDQDRVAIADIEKYLLGEAQRNKITDSVKNSVWCSDGHCDRGPLYEETAALPQDLYVFTGELDLQTLPEETRRLERACRAAKKKNCRIEIVPKLQHGFNRPKGPRHHPLLDIAVGPVEHEFSDRLYRLARELKD